MTFNIKECKDDIKYIVLATSSSAECFNGQTRLIKNGKMYIWHPTAGLNQGGVLSDSLYDSWVLTCKYPDTIEEAAKILDAHYPDWANKVQTVKQDSIYNCILGQLYSRWQSGIHKLFNINLDALSGDEFKKYGNDTVFGNNASNAEWEAQIVLRTKKVATPLLTFWEAMNLLTQGKKVRRTTWDKNRYWMMVRSTSMVRSYTSGDMAIDIPTPLGCCLLNDWELYTELTFKDLKAGDKFTIMGEVISKKMIKSQKEGFAINAAQYLDIINVDSEAIVEKL